MWAKYIVRLDDACPTMNKGSWEYLESILDFYNIKPIVAVIPSNLDNKMNLNEPAQDFWEKVKKWELKNWTIGLHGFEHLANTCDGGILNFNKKSEFSGLPIEDQRERIIKGWEVFKGKKISPSIWIAPFHSFDRNTLKIIRETTTIKYISDGVALAPYFEDGFVWIPQQLWNFRSMPFGLWTICLHPNMMSFDDIDVFKNKLILYKEKIINIDYNNIQYRKYNLLDKTFKYIFYFKKNIYNK